MSHTMLIRADASTVIGTGHVMRSLALAQGWQRAGGQAIFAEAESTPTLERRLRTEGVGVVRLNLVPGSVEDAARTVELAYECQAAWIVADGYRFGTAWQRRIKDSGLRLLLWDDYGHAEHYWADLVLNQNLYTDANIYVRREHYTRLLLGTQYVQLRREFLDWRNWQREFPAVARKVLVTLGGADPDNVTGKIIQSLAGLHDVEAVVAIGNGNPNLDSLQVSSRNSQVAIRLVVDANMPEQMAWADVAVSAAGSTAWELAFMGLPSIVIVLAENQAEIAAALEREGVSVCLGEHTRVSVERIAAGVQSLLADRGRRQQFSQGGRELVDGLGTERVVNELNEQPVAMPMVC